MEFVKNRKLATDNQIRYANAIAKALNINVRFPERFSFYDVSMFIKENEDAFKHNMSIKTASKRQIDYANAIANVCGINQHFSEGDLFDNVNNFIKKHVDRYKQITWRHEIIENPKTYENTIFDTKTLLFVCDHLYKKHRLYAFTGENNQILYIGKSTDLSQRITTSYNERKRQANICSIFYYILDNMADVNILEILLICENKPALNSESNTSDIPSRFYSNINILTDFIKLPTREME